MWDYDWYQFKGSVSLVVGLTLVVVRSTSAPPPRLCGSAGWSSLVVCIPVHTVCVRISWVVR